VAASLSEEQKRRIENEEQSHLAEESYREEVRHSLRRTRATKKRPSAGFVVLVVAIVILGALWIASASHSPLAASDVPAVTPFTQWVPVSTPLAEGQFEVRAQQYLTWKFVVPASGIRNYRVVGHYSVVGGSGNDIQAVVATEDEFQNWINGHKSRSFYASPGKVTTGGLNVALPPGRYVLAFNNRFSLLSNKAVLAEIKATYDQVK
jgi:hypothetical protein